MKFAAITIAAIVAMTNVVTGTIAAVEMPTSDPSTTVLSQSKALEAAKHTSIPDGVEFTGSVEKIDQPDNAKETLEAMQTKHDDGDKQEGFGWGHGRRFGWSRRVGQLGRMGRVWTLPLRLPLRGRPRMGIPAQLLEHLRRRSLRRWLQSWHAVRRPILLLTSTNHTQEKIDAVHHILSQLALLLAHANGCWCSLPSSLETTSHQLHKARLAVDMTVRFHFS